MRVEELAKDLSVGTDALLHLLRGMGIHVSEATDAMSDADVALVLAKVERARRAGTEDAAEALEAAVEESSSGSRRRRRRRRRAPEPELEPDVASEEVSAEADEQEEGADEAEAEPEEIAAAPGEPVAVDDGVGEEPVAEADGGDEVPGEEAPVQATPSSTVPLALFVTVHTLSL